MAIEIFSAVDQSTIWDVVLNTYGSVDDIVKLMQDNNFKNVNTYPENAQEFEFDDTLVVNQNSLQSNLAIGKFATRDRTTTNDSTMIYYEQTLEAEYTSNADGTITVNLPALIGSRILWLERETRPIEKANYTWNSISGILTFLNGVTIDNGQTLFIQYVVTIQS